MSPAGGPPGVHASVCAESVARVEVFPAASKASTASAYVVPHVSPVNV